MNALRSPPATETSLHLQRSHCLDAFAQLEQAIVALLHALEIKTGAESLGQKLTALGKAQPSSRFSKARVTGIKALITTCEELAAVRNDIVHAKLHIVVIDDEPKACFINTREYLAGSQSARILSDSGLRQLRSNVARMAVEFNQALINPAFLPRPPSLAAAGGP